MNSKKQGFLDKLLYKLIVGSHCEDYVSEDKNGKVVRTPAGLWQSCAFNQKSQQQR